MLMFFEARKVVWTIPRPRELILPTVHPSDYLHILQERQIALYYFL